LWSIPNGRGDQPTASNLEENIMATPIYLDFNTTTPIDPAVVDAMLPYLREQFGNPSSDRAYGYRTRAAVQTAREQLLI
jgi:selenocysteine lyase/cysteine desulfurase